MIKILRLHIYGFGKHTNKIIQLQEGMNIFYGQNEAGKTTIQQFILQIFFGFPQKNSILAKYEPKTASRFGGQIQLLHPKFGQCTIERVKGKANGDVTVQLENGDTGHEELLAKLLYGYSRPAFEAIFAFSLHELQGIERMSEDELSRVLLASGTTGVDQLTKVERKLEKEMGELYKRSGRNPLINQKIEQLKQTERRIQEEQAKIATYDSELSRLTIVEELLSTKQQQQQSLQVEWQNTSILQQALPLLQEQHQLIDELAEMTVTQFPTDGIRRYEQLKDRYLHVDAKTQQLEKQKQELQTRLTEQLNAHRFTALQQLVEQESEWHRLQASLKALQEELVLLRVEEDNHYRLLGIHESSERQAIAVQNVSLQEEEKFQLLLARLEQLEERQKMHTLTIERVRDELDEIEHRLRQLQQEQPSEQERKLLEEWPTKQQRLEQLKAQEQGAKQGANPSGVSYIIIILAAATLIFGLWQKNWPVLIVAVVLLVVGVQLLRQQNSTKQSAMQSSNLRHTLYELRELEQQELNIVTLKERVNRFDERLHLLQEQRQSKISQYKKVELELVQLETDGAISWGEVEQFLTRFYIEGVTQRKLLPELFTRVREVQRLAIVIANKQLTLTSSQHQQEQFIEEATKLTLKPCTQESIFVYVREAFREYEQRKNEVAHWEKQLKDMTEQLLLEDVERQAMKAKLQELFLLAQVEDEQAFYGAEADYKQFTAKKDRLHFVEQQIKMVNMPSLQTIPTVEELESQLIKVDEQQTTIQQQLDELLQEKASLQYSTNALLTDEGYGQLLQVFEQKKAELAVLVKQWSIQKAIVASIEQTMQVLREEKLPKVLEEVNKLFSVLTGERYNELSINDASNFEALAKDGMRYHVAELSQATKEQAYVALRFALAKSLSEAAPFPFIMDDPFVHFDRNRMGYMVQLMKEVEYDRQILYFTCHHAIKTEWQDAHHIDLSIIEDERGVISI